MISAYLHVHPVTYFLDKKVRLVIRIDQGHNGLKCGKFTRRLSTLTLSDRLFNIGGRTRMSLSRAKWYQAYF